MGRFFLTLAFLMLVLLLIDSGMNDPDVQPVVDRQIRHVQHQIEAISSWIHTSPVLPWNDDPDSASASTAENIFPHDGHGSRWYWSTMLAMAMAARSLAKSVTEEVSRPPVPVTVPLRVLAHPTGRRP